MKNLLLALSFLAVVGLASCESDSIEPSGETSLVDLFSLATVGDSTGRPMKKLTQVPVSELAAAITSYIETTYPGSTIQGAAKGENGFTMVKIQTSDNKPLVLVFDTNQAFVKALNPKSHHGTPIAIADLPAVITAYITQNYPGSTILHARTGPEGRFGVLIRKADETVVVAGFQADGTFIAEVKPGDHGRKRKRK